MVIIGSVLTRERTGAAFGMFTSMMGLAAVSGPTLGSALTTYLGWRWMFYVTLPIAAGIALAYAFAPEIRTGRRPRLDVPGVLLSTQRSQTSVPREGAWQQPYGASISWSEHCAASYSTTMQGRSAP